MDPLATNAETLNDEWGAYDLAKAKELARPLGTFDDELALNEEERQNGAVLPYRSQRWYRAILREFEREKIARRKKWAEKDAEREKVRAEEEERAREEAAERAREAAEERILERARTHGLRDAAATIVGASVLRLCWQFFWLWWMLLLGTCGVLWWTPNGLVFVLLLVLEWLGNSMSMGFIHAMVKERFDPVAAWVLTVVAAIAANETTDAMFPAELHGLSPLWVFVDIIITR
tara:strand:+ start:147 stop:845 length:699 start_codon:yes stop_codon:yes gene_type:complete